MSNIVIVEHNRTFEQKRPFELYLTLANEEHQKNVEEYSAPPELPDVMKPATDVDKQ